MVCYSVCVRACVRVWVCVYVCVCVCVCVCACVRVRVCAGACVRMYLSACPSRQRKGERERLCVCHPSQPTHTHAHQPICPFAHS